MPLFWWQVSLKDKRVQMFGNRLRSSVLLGVIIGAGYFFLVRRLNLLVIRWETSLLGIVLATAVTEELVFSGFVAGYLEKIQKGRLINLLIVGLMVAVIKMPILLFFYKLGMMDLSGVILFAWASGVINAWIRVETGNVSGSILARMGMNLAVLG